MKTKTLLAISVLAILTGCGRSGDTYVKTDPVQPNTPTGGNAIIVTADNGASSGISYTEVGNSGVLVSCGNGCNIAVNKATPIAPADTNTTTTP